MTGKGDRRLGVWMNGERVGTWTDKQGKAQTFAYDDAWLDSAACRPISLSIPLASSRTPIAGPEVVAFFDNLLPDNADIRRRIQRRFACPTGTPFDLLSAIGRDCVGALQILPEEEEPLAVREIRAEPLSESAIAAHIVSVGVDAIPGAAVDESFRISIAGAQEKTALLFHGGVWQKPIGSTPTTHILKLPLGRIGAMQADMESSIENEWLCLKILEAFGIEVAKAEIARFENLKVLAVERFDRRYSRDGSWLMRIPQEDLCQATGTPPDRKYESEGGPGIIALTSLLRGAREPLSDMKKFLKANVLFWLLAAPDGHAKNFSIFLERQGRFSLTPCYDVMSVYPILGHEAGKLPPEKLRMAMAVTGQSRHYEWAKIQKRHWIETAERCGAGRIMGEALDEISAAVPSVVGTIENALPQGFPEEVASAILLGLSAANEKII